VSSEEPARQGAASLDQLLAGRISGVIVTAAPGGGIIVRIGGPTSFYSDQDPLFVIDGVPVQVSRGTLTWLSAHDVESITALKGADAAIYGVRGSNGVIVIKTKGSH
jgi:iron complex outermembrane receptor protein